MRTQGRAPLVELPRAPREARPAATRAALMGDAIARKRAGLRGRLRRLHARGYNTFVLPVLRKGVAGLAPAARRTADRFAGPFEDAVRAFAELDGDASLWAIADPLSAGVPGSGRLGPLAAANRDWLMRNARGAGAPIGASAAPGQFCWMNRGFCRALEGILSAATDSYPVTALILDWRELSSPALEDESLACFCPSCQEAVEETLGVDLEELLGSGDAGALAAWRTWRTDQLRRFMERIKARAVHSRPGLSVKALVRFESEYAPWLDWLAEGLVDELCVECDPERLRTVVETVDRHAGERRLVLPVLAAESGIEAALTRSRTVPVPGFLVLDPDADEDAELPRTAATWTVGGAVEDSPREAIAAHLWPHAGDPAIESLLKMLDDPTVGAEAIARAIEAIPVDVGAEEGTADHGALAMALDLGARLLSAAAMAEPVPQ